MCHDRCWMRIALTLLVLTLAAAPLVAADEVKKNEAKKEAAKKDVSASTDTVVPKNPAAPKNDPALKKTAGTKDPASPKNGKPPKKSDAPKTPDKPKPRAASHANDALRPAVVDPGEADAARLGATPPSDAVVLFDGKNLDRWEGQRRSEGKMQTIPAPWKVADGCFEVVPGSGNLYTKEKFGDCQIHLEWATPAKVQGRGQGRGNSGVFLGGFGEVQVLDSWQNDTYPDGQAAALYSRSPPLVNASRRPGQWQTYDILVQAAKVDARGKVVRPGRLTLLHNGVVVHHAFEFPGRQGPFDIKLQDHRCPVRYRNIWVRPIKDYGADGTPPPPPPPPAPPTPPKPKTPKAPKAPPAKK